MLIVSYDIQDDKLRAKFNKMLCKNGCVRLQYSVYEMNNTQRNIDNLILKINEFGLKFEGG
jgi:CRISPR-associated protein Cas2